MKTPNAKKPIIDRRLEVNSGKRVTDKFYQIISDNIPGSVITIDKDGYITSANKNYCEFNCNECWVGKNIFQDNFYIQEKLVPEFRKLLKYGTIVTKENCHAMNCKGEDKYLKIIATPFRDHTGKIAGAICLASDNTEAALLQKELIDLNESLEKKVTQRTEELNILNEELKKVLDLKSIFMADVSHEFRTALTIMQCSLELISKSGDIKAENQEMFGNITTEIKRISTMLADLALLTKSDSITLKSHHKIVDLNSLVSNICKELQVIANNKKVKIEYKPAKSAVKIKADKEDIEKLVFNLIGNAIKYNKTKGWVKVSIQKEKEGIILTVKDGGIGIPKKDLPNIFERFYRVDKARTRQEGGSGLGLAICQHIAGEYGGNINVESKEGQGSTFSVYLPENHK